MAGRPSTVGARLYRWLLQVLPTDFRGDFGDAMLADVEVAAQRGVFWWREIGGLLRAVAREHLDALAQDVRYALRMMRRTPGFTVAAVLMLAVGTGVNVAVFSVIDAVLIKSSLPDADRVVLVTERAPDGAETTAIPLAHLDTLARAPMIAALSQRTGSLAILRGVGAPHRLDIECVSASMFDVVQTRPLIGRAFSRDEDVDGGPAVVVLSYQTWQRDFGGDPAILGRTIDLGGAPNTVIGVMPRGFIGPTSRNRTAGWAPIAPALAHHSAVGCNQRGPNANVIARLRAPYTRESAASAARAMGLIAALPMSQGQLGGQVIFDRADNIMMSGVRTPFAVLVGAVACVLLIACANVANLQLERQVGRRRELALRRALGASRGRVVRQTLTENILLSGIGSLVGLAGARLALGAIVQMMPATIPHIADIHIGARAVGMAIACALLVGVAVGSAPAWHGASPVLDGELRSSRGVAGGAEWLRRGLVIAEVALSVLLLVGAGLLVRTFLVLRPDAPGFSADGRVVAETSMRGEWTASVDRLRAIERMSAGMAALPGVQSVSVSSYLPFSGFTDQSTVRFGDVSGTPFTSWVSAGYFADMNMTITGGRGFTDRDTAAGPPVIVINDAAARKFFPTSSPIGNTLAITTSDRSTTVREVVGVIGDSRSGGLDTRVRPEVFIPIAQQPAPTLIYFLLRTNEPSSGPLAAGIRAAVTTVDPMQIVDAIDSLQDRLDRSVSRPRFGAWLFGIFAAIALSLALAGLAATIAWWVAQRRREIGVRMALGARPMDVSLLVVRQGLILTLAGVLVGAIGAWFATRLLAEWIYGVSPTDPATFAVCGAGMAGLAALAAFVPARRAAAIDPAITLRGE